MLRAQAASNGQVPKAPTDEYKNIGDAKGSTQSGGEKPATGSEILACKAQSNVEAASQNPPEELMQKIMQIILKDQPKSVSEDKKLNELRTVSKSFDKAFCATRENLNIVKKKMSFSELVELLQKFTGIKSINVHDSIIQVDSMISRVYRRLFNKPLKSVDSVSALSFDGDVWPDSIYQKIRIGNPINKSALTASVKYFPGVKLLSLNNQIEMKDEVLIAYVEKNPEIDCIHLQSCFCLSDKSIVVLAEKCQKLTEVDLSRQRVNLLNFSQRKTWSELTDQSINALAEHCPNLEWLDISGCEKITESAVINLLVSAKNLKYLNYGNREYKVGDINEIRIRHQGSSELVPAGVSLAVG